MPEGFNDPISCCVILKDQQRSDCVNGTVVDGDWIGRENNVSESLCRIDLLVCTLGMPYISHCFNDLLLCLRDLSDCRQRRHAESEENQNGRLCD